MKSKNEYLGDDKFKKFLEHYNCPTPLEVVKLRFAGAICSPNMELRPADVISSLWAKNEQPRLTTKNEADLFFKYFMGLWDEMFEIVTNKNISLSRISADENLILVCQNRYDEIEQGFVEGFWGGKQDFKMPKHIAEVIDSITELAETYHLLMTKINPEKKNETVFKALLECDKMAVKSFNFLIDNYVLPHIDSLRKTVN